MVSAYYQTVTDVYAGWISQTRAASAATSQRARSAAPIDPIKPLRSG
jgi:hypothetical protein